MTRLLSTLCLGLSLGLALSGCRPPTPDASQMGIFQDGVYRHEQLGIEIKAPAGWFVLDETGMTELVALGQELADSSEPGGRVQHLFGAFRDKPGTGEAFNPFMTAIMMPGGGAHAADHALASVRNDLKAAGVPHQLQDVPTVHSVISWHESGFKVRLQNLIMNPGQPIYLQLMALERANQVILFSVGTLQAPTEGLTLQLLVQPLGSNQ